MDVEGNRAIGQLERKDGTDVRFVPAARTYGCEGRRVASCMAEKGLSLSGIEANRYF